jgi:hypothetical protein
LGVLIIKVDPDSDSYIEEKALKDLQQSMLIRYISSSLVRVLDKELRRIDMIIKQPNKNQLVLVFPETDSDGTQTMVERISNLSKQKLGISVSCGYAAFPDDALTFDELVQRAESYVKDHPSHFADFLAEKVKEASLSTEKQN